MHDELRPIASALLTATADFATTGPTAPEPSLSLSALTVCNHRLNELDAAPRDADNPQRRDYENIAIVFGQITWQLVSALSASTGASTTDIVRNLRSNFDLDTEGSLVT